MEPIILNLLTLLVVILIFFFQQRNEIRREIWEKEKEINRLFIDYSRRIRDKLSQMKNPILEISNFQQELEQLKKEREMERKRVISELNQLKKRGKWFLIK